MFVDFYSRSDKYGESVLVEDRRVLARNINKLIAVVGAGVFSLLNYSVAEASNEVHVAAYEFPPFYSSSLDRHVVGDLVSHLNTIQTDFYFTVENIPVSGRYRAIEADGCCDLIMFEAPEWGWSDAAGDPEENIAISAPLLAGSERFVTHKANNYSESDFSRLNGKRLGGISGYHYNYDETSDSESGQGFGMYLAKNHRTNIRMLLNGRLDMIILSDAYLASLEKMAYYRNLHISSQQDSTYELSIVVNNNKAIQLEEVMNLFAELRRSGKFAQVMQSYNLESFLIDENNLTEETAAKQTGAAGGGGHPDEQEINQAA